MRSEKEKMLAGELYHVLDAELTAERTRARWLLRWLNETPPDQPEERARIIRQLIGRAGARVTIEPPFYCDYGSNITLGDDVFFNFNCVILDVMPVEIGSRVLFGPGVQVYAATHPLQAAARQTGLEYGRAVSIGNDVWVGGGAIICPGVRIGDGTVIGAGSVVTRDIPEGVLAVGNPCRVQRQLTE